MFSESKHVNPHRHSGEGARAHGCQVWKAVLLNLSLHVTCTDEITPVHVIASTRVISCTDVSVLANGKAEIIQICIKLIKHIIVT